MTLGYLRCKPKYKTLNKLCTTSNLSMDAKPIQHELNTVKKQGTEVGLMDFLVLSWARAIELICSIVIALR